MAAHSPHDSVGPELQMSVRREWDVPHVVASIQQFCRRAGASTVLAAQVATVASELANNLWMHATHGGEILVRACRRDQRLGFELQAQDQGPGIADLQRALEEGYSTAGGMGCGLPGAQRLMDEFAIDSAPGLGTRVRAVKWLPAAPKPERRLCP